ncbi:hypothetical protein J2M53_12895 [Arthrobacter sp. zg-ZUI100]|uniref:hypothetical protein n=1 Tax=Arthrobacter jiangjiafuii TaxID=2817475 RepID=UPI001AED8AFF|nr:hypothetical protein [Arthrobacter jiangjiafuii]MBP3037141.1 hypothetical protein [Arthrobacter jiangjiafuii]
MQPPAARRIRRGRKLFGAAAVGALAAAVSLTGASSALAADGYLQFSLDGQTYSSAISGPIFHQAINYVPGTASTASLWVRNSSGEPASLSSAAVMVRSAPELSGHLSLQAGIAPDLSVRSALGLQGSCSDIKQVWELDAAEELQLSFVVDFSVDAPNETMNKDAEFDVLFLLESKAAGVSPRPVCSALTVPAETPTGSPGSDSGNGSGSGGVTVTGRQAAQLATVRGAGSGASAQVASGIPAFGIRAAGQSNSVPAGRLPADASQLEVIPPNGIVPAGFHSTVEPIIRSLSGTLLIVMSVLFCAAVVLRLRNRQA